MRNYQNFPPEYAPYNTRFGEEVETIGHMLWDSATYVSATTLRLQFFNAVRASLDLGNMETPSQLPAPKAFLIRAVRFYLRQQPEATTAVATATQQTGLNADMAQLLNHGVLELIVGSKVYVQIPLWAIPSGGGVKGIMTGADADVVIQYATNGVPDPRAVFTLSKPLFLAPQINFSVVVSWPPGPLTLALGDTIVTVGLDGDLVRSIQ